MQTTFILDRQPLDVDGSGQYPDTLFFVVESDSGPADPITIIINGPREADDPPKDRMSLKEMREWLRPYCLGGFAIEASDRNGVWPVLFD